MSDESILIERVLELTAALTPQATGIEAKLDPVPNIRAVLFDVYGTLVISASGDIGLTAETTHMEAFLDAWQAVGLEPAFLPTDYDGPAELTALIHAEHERARAAGIDHPEVDILALWRALLADLEDTVESSADSTLMRRLALEYELRTNPVWPMPGLTEMLQRLAQRGLVLGIVSNAQFYTPLMLAAFLGEKIQDAGFDPQCCAWSYLQGVGKPSTRVYQPALHGLSVHHGIEPHQILYIGNDMRNDIHPAQLLGCRTALFAGDARSLRLRADHAALRGVEPDRILTELQQIPDQLLPKD